MQDSQAPSTTSSSNPYVCQVRDFDSTIYVRKVTLGRTPEEHILNCVSKSRVFSREWVRVLESVVNVSPQVRPSGRVTDPSKVIVEGTSSVIFLWDKLMSHVVYRDAFGLNINTKKCRQGWLLMMTVIHALTRTQRSKEIHF